MQPLETRYWDWGEMVDLRLIFIYQQLSNQKRQLLKDKFKGFNTELEELHRIQKDWSLPDPVLRSRVRDDNIELIIPLYTTFYQM